MAILTVENTAGIGMPVRIFDADGNEIKDCVYADTETGFCGIIQRSSSGELVVDCGELVRAGVDFKSPLQVERVVT